MSYRWDYVAREIYLEITTQFTETLLNGMIGGLIVQMHRTLAMRESNAVDTDPVNASAIVRADAAVLRSGGSTVFV